MTSRAPNLRRGITRLEIVIIVGLIGFCGGLFGFWPGTVLLILLFGWIKYPFDVAGDITIEPVAVLTSCLAMVLFTCGIYAFGKWIARETSREERRRSWTFSQSVQLVLLILFAFVAGTSMIGIVHQITWMATTEENFLESGHRAARRSASKNNLKGVGLAQHNYHDTFDFFATSTFAPDGSAQHSLQTYLIPYIDSNDIITQINLDVPWSHPDNAEIFQRELSVYLNPGVDFPSNPNQPAPSHYASNIRVLSPNGSVSLKNITDGTSNTILMGEVNANFRAWGDPTNLRDPARGINKSPQGFGSPFQGGGQFLFVDGRVRFISEEIDPAVLKALATPAGGERIPDDY